MLASGVSQKAYFSLVFVILVFLLEILPRPRSFSRNYEAFSVSVPTAHRKSHFTTPVADPVKLPALWAEVTGAGVSTTPPLSPASLSAHRKAPQHAPK
jgi:hypothetical protein